ncbi:uncharacterized protein LJ264_012519 isoform 1-T2 [Porphyrio hochstetteri]
MAAAARGARTLRRHPPRPGALLPLGSATSTPRGSGIRAAALRGAPMGCGGPRRRGRALRPPARAGPGVRGRCWGLRGAPPKLRSARFLSSILAQKVIPAAASPRSVGQGWLVFQSSLSRWPACWIELRNYSFSGNG